jgi:hypothetical protein
MKTQRDMGENTNQLTPFEKGAKLLEATLAPKMEDLNKEARKDSGENTNQPTGTGENIISPVVTGSPKQEELKTQAPRQDTGQKYFIPSTDWDGKEVKHSEKINDVINFIDANPESTQKGDDKMLELAMLLTNMDKFPANETAQNKPLKVLKVKNYYGFINLILAGGNIEDMNSFKQTLLHESLNHGEFGACLCLWLIKKGANVSAETKFMQCALHMCIIKTNLNALRVVINEGINVNADDK